MPTPRSDRLTLSVIVVVSILLIYYSYTVFLANRANAGAYQLYLLDENRMANQYFPDNNSNLTVGTEMTWHLIVGNTRSTAQTVTVKVKLGNATLGPHPLNCTPAPLTSVVEYERTLLPDELGEFPFNWTIEAIKTTQDTVAITHLVINDALTTLPPVQARYGFNFRLIFELWIANTTNGDLQYGWVQEGQRKCAFTQMWFNATTPEGSP